MKYLVKFVDNDRTLTVEADRIVIKADEGLVHFLDDSNNKLLVVAAVSIRNMLFYKVD